MQPLHLTARNRSGGTGYAATNMASRPRYDQEGVMEQAHRYNRLCIPYVLGMSRSSGRDVLREAVRLLKARRRLSWRRIEDVVRIMRPDTTRDAVQACSLAHP